MRPSPRRTQKTRAWEKYYLAVANLHNPEGTEEAQDAASVGVRIVEYAQAVAENRTRRAAP